MNADGTLGGPYDLGGRRARVLIVDDQPTNIVLIHQIFAKSHDTFMSRSGEEALHFCRTNPPDLVLLDVEMPGMDGLEVCRRLQAQAETQDIPVIFVTGRELPNEEIACWEAGCVDFVNKPVNATTLRNRVHAHLKLKFQADLLRDLAFIDGLTGVANRRSFDEKLVSEWRRCSRSGAPLALILADVDHFKKFNDFYGHQAGDTCLRSVAATLKSSFNRPFDLVARYGGEEFVCLLPETDLHGVQTAANRLIEAVHDLRIEHLASAVDTVVTISAGGTSLAPGQENNSAAVLALADLLLYRAKQEGRARACVESAG